jgi:hypothetical protein
MQNGPYVADSAQASLPRRLQAIGDNVANRNAVGRGEAGADPRQRGQIGAAPIPDRGVKSAPRIYAAMNQSIETPGCEDRFIDLAAARCSGAKPVES